MHVADGAGERVDVVVVCAEGPVCPPEGARELLCGHWDEDEVPAPCLVGEREAKTAVEARAHEGGVGVVCGVNVFSSPGV